jgi:hypothetical protein
MIRRTSLHGSGTQRQLSPRKSAARRLASDPTSRSGDTRDRTKHERHVHHWVSVRHVHLKLQLRPLRGHEEALQDRHVRNPRGIDRAYKRHQN